MQDRVITTSHKKIRHFVEDKQGEPEIIDDIKAGNDEVGIRINFPGPEDDIFIADSKHRETKWKKFFKIFEDKKLAMIIDEDDKDMYRFIKRA